MSQFAQAIRSYRSGVWSREQLLIEVDRQLAEHHAAPAALLAILDSEHADKALPGEVHRAVVQRIASWLPDHTLLRQPRMDAAGVKTVLMRKPGAENSLESDPSRPRATTVGVGSVLQGRFKLLELVGEGGMSRVYKAIDLRRVEANSPDPYIAVKVLTVPFSDYFDSIQALQREADKLQSLTHPNIVRAIDVDRDGQTVFMTMKLLSGESLRDKLVQPGFTGMPQQQAQRVVTAIAAALEFAHRARIVHGDLKPGNVIITDQGEVNVIDFGIARFLARPTDGDSPEYGEHWESLEALTPQYASPEMLEDKEPDPRDDVYALACIAYEVLTGEHPFGHVAATEARNADMKVARRGTITGHQFKAILGGLQFDRSRRTASAQEFMDEFTGERAGVWKRALAVAGAAAAAILIGWYVNRGVDQSGVPAEPRAALLAGQVLRDCPTCPLMRVLPAGAFMQGSDVEAAEQPRHRVGISTPIAFASNEVTTAEFAEFAADTNLQSNGCSVYSGEWQQRADINWRNFDDARTALHPAICVSWDEAAAYAAWLSKKTGQIYRLPSASEWEYAAGAASSASLNANSAGTCRFANIADQAAAQRYPGWDVIACNDRYVQTAPVGSFAANAFGLHDMIGNVFEWVQDCWSDTYEGAPVDGSARVDGDCAQREMRGGSWFTTPRYLRPSYRNRFGHGYRSSSVGFRVVREIHS